MSPDTLNNYTLKDLAQLAKKRGVSGWHAMRKDQLVKVLARPKHAKPGGSKARKPVAATRRAASASAVASRRDRNGRPKASLPSNGKPKSAHKAAPKVNHDRITQRLLQQKAQLDSFKNLATEPLAAKSNGQHESPSNGQSNGASNGQTNRQSNRLSSSRSNGAPKPHPVKDRLVVMVRDPFWLHAYWELTRHSVERAQAAMGQEWHSARPILRLLEVSAGTTTSSAEKPVRDIEIHGGVNNWYIDVQDPPHSYRLDIGYLAPSGKMFVLARSNIVTTPKAGSVDAIDENWTEVAENFEKIYAMSGGYSSTGPAIELQELFEERLRRPMGSPMVTRFGPGAEGLVPRKREFSFELDAELIVFGVTEPNAYVTLQGDPVKVRPDGSFTVRFSMPNCRQVIPAVANSSDGLEQRTIVLAVERNTKVMEPLVRDGNEH